MVIKITYLVFTLRHHNMKKILLMYLPIYLGAVKNRMRKSILDMLKFLNEVKDEAQITAIKDKLEKMDSKDFKAIIKKYRILFILIFNS